MTYLFFAGLACVVAGFAWIFPPAGLIAAGLFAVVIALKVGEEA